MPAKFEIYKDKKGEFRFRLRAAIGETITTGESYPTKAVVNKGIASIKKNPPEAPIEEATSEATALKKAVAKVKTKAKVKSVPKATAKTAVKSRGRSKARKKIFL